MSCRTDLYKARTAIERLLLDMRDVEQRLGCCDAQLRIHRARAFLAAADIELGHAVPQIAPDVVFEICA